MSMSTSMRNILLAVLLAVGAAVAVIAYTSSVKDQAKESSQTVQVLVATRDIVAGETAEAAAKGMALKDVPVDFQVPGSIADAASLGGLVATQTIHAGEQVVATVFQQAIGQDAQINLAPTERAIRIEMTMISGAVGAVQPGQTVDLFGSFKVPNTEFWLSRRVLTGVRLLEAPKVLASAKDEEAKGGGLGSGGDAGSSVQVSMMLAVQQKDATKVAFMASNTQGAVMWMAVRPPDDKAKEQVVTIEQYISMLEDGVPPAEATKKLALLATSAGGATGGSGDGVTAQVAPASDNADPITEDGPLGQSGT